VLSSFATASENWTDVVNNNDFEWQMNSLRAMDTDLLTAEFEPILSPVFCIPFEGRPLAKLEERVKIRSSTKYLQTVADAYRLLTTITYNDHFSLQFSS
jgi:hypothetical protein